MLILAFTLAAVSFVKTDKFHLMNVGLGVVMIAAALSSFPILGVFSIPLGPLGAILLIVGSAKVRRADAGSAVAARAAAGLILSVLSALLLLYLAFSTTFHAHAIAMARLYPNRMWSSGEWSSGEWVQQGLLWLLPALSYGIGMRLRADWSLLRCVAWGLAVLAVIPAALVLFLILARVWPLTA